MRYNLLGRTGLYVSELCLGTMTFGGKGFWEVIEKLGQKQVEAIVGTSLDGGVNFVDKADVYSEGESEQLLGSALKALGRPREQVVVATKVRGRMWEGPNGEGLSRAHVIRACEDSLRRMQTDYIDLYQTHHRDKETPIEEITPKGLRAGGVEYELDVIVFATGFDAFSGSFLRIDIRGRNGVRLADRWQHGPTAYLGLSIAGFPNL